MSIAKRLIEEELDAVALKIDGYDDCISGQTSCWNNNEKVDRIIYDGEALIDAMMDDGMSYEEAVEYIEFNIEGAYVGPTTPMVMWPYAE